MRGSSRIYHGVPRFWTRTKFHCRDLNQVVERSFSNSTWQDLIEHRVRPSRDHRQIKNLSTVKSGPGRSSHYGACGLLVMALLGVGCAQALLEESQDKDETVTPPTIEGLRALEKTLRNNFLPNFKLPRKAGSESQEEYRRRCELRCFDAVRTACNMACRNENWTSLCSHRDTLTRITDPKGYSLFLSFVADRIAGRVDLIKALLENQLGGCYRTDNEKNNALHLAVQRNRLAVVTLLAAKFHKERNAAEQTALHIAISSGKRLIVAELLRSNHNPTEKAPWGENQVWLDAFSRSVAEGQSSCMAAIYQHYCDATGDTTALSNPFPIGDGSGSILHLAIQTGQDEIVRLLLNEYVPKALEILDKSGRSALGLAADRGNCELVRFLAVHQLANLNSEDANKETSLDRAVLRKDVAMIQLLVRLGAASDSAKTIANVQNAKTGGADETYRVLIELDAAIAGQKKITIGAPDYLLRHPQNIAFQGGGAKGVLHVGALQALEERKLLDSVHRVAGTSAGAIAATLFAVGYSPKEIKDILFNFNFDEFLDTHDDAIFEAIFTGKDATGTLWDKFVKGGKIFINEASPSDWISLADQMVLSKTPGLCKGEYARNWIDEKISSKLAEITGEPQLNYQNLTFGELADLVRRGGPVKHLHVYATKLQAVDAKDRIERFASEDRNLEFEHAGQDWKMNVVIADAIFASMAIPGVYKPAEVRVKLGENDFLPRKERYIDGGLLKNNPLTSFDYEGYTKLGVPKKDVHSPVNNNLTLGLALRDKSYRPAKEGLSGLIALAKDLATIYYKAQDALLYKDKANRDRTIFLEYEGIGTLDFDLTQRKKLYLLGCGVQAISQKFKRADDGSTHVPSNIFSSLYHVARDKLERTLAAAFAEDVSKKTVVRLLHGKPGAGKKELAARVVEKRAVDDSVVWRLDGSSREHLERDYRELGRAYKITLAQDASLETVQAKVNEFLEKQPANRPWILLFQGQEDKLNRDNLPKRGGYVVITSRTCSAWSSTKDQIEVGELTLKEAKAIWQSTGRDELTKDDLKLFEALQYSAGAITLAARHITQSDIEIDDFLKKLKRHAEVDASDEALGPVGQVIATMLDSLSSEARLWLTTVETLERESLPLAWLTQWDEMRFGRHVRKDVIGRVMSTSHSPKLVAELEHSNLARVGRHGSDDVVNVDRAVMDVLPRVQHNIDDKPSTLGLAFKWLKRVGESSRDSDAFTFSDYGFSRWSGSLLRILRSAESEENVSSVDRGEAIDLLVNCALDRGDYQTVRESAALGIQSCEAQREMSEEINLEIAAVELNYLDLLARASIRLNDTAASQEASKRYLALVKDYLKMQGQRVESIGLFLAGASKVIDAADGKNRKVLSEGVDLIDRALNTLNATEAEDISIAEFQTDILLYRGWGYAVLAHDNRADLVEAEDFLNTARDSLEQYKGISRSGLLSYGYARLCKQWLTAGEYSSAETACDCAEETFDLHSPLPPEGLKEYGILFKDLARHTANEGKKGNYLWIARTSLENVLQEADTAELKGNVEMHLSEVHALGRNPEMASQLQSLAESHIKKRSPDHQLFLQIKKRNEDADGWNFSDYLWAPVSYVSSWFRDEDSK